MSSQQLPEPGAPPPGHGETRSQGGNPDVGSQANPAGGEEGRGEATCSPGALTSSSSGSSSFQDEKREAVMVSPCPQVQGWPVISLQHPASQPSPPVSTPSFQIPKVGHHNTMNQTATPSRLIALAPASRQEFLTVLPKPSGHISVTMESNVSSTPSIPVATVSGQQGHSSNIHLMTSNVQIIRSSASTLHVASSAPPTHTFASHLPRGAAVTCSPKGVAVLRPASDLSPGSCQPTVQYVPHQPLQLQPMANTSTAVLAAVTAPVTVTRAQSPVITTATTHSSEVAHGKTGLPIHLPPAAGSVQWLQPPREVVSCINVPLHPAVGAQKPQPQKSVFSTLTPIATAAVTPILCTSTTGSVVHPQMTPSTVVGMIPHSCQAAALTTSAIPVAKVIPQPVAHTSPRIPSDNAGEQDSLVTVETVSDSRSSIPMQFQYILPTYSSSPYPLRHTYTPSSVSAIQQYPITPQAHSSTPPAQASVGVASKVHLNPLQLMAVERIGLQAAQMNTQGVQSAAISAQDAQSAPGEAQVQHVCTQGIQHVPVSLLHQQQTELNASGLADGSSLAGHLTGTTGSMAQVYQQSHSSASMPASSPRPSILRKKPASEGSAARKRLIPAKTSEMTSSKLDSSARCASGSPGPAGVTQRPDVHVAFAALTSATMEGLSSQGPERLAMASPTVHFPQAVPTLTAMAGPSPGRSAASSAGAVSLPVPDSGVNVVTLPTPLSASSGVAFASGASLSDIKIKPEMMPMNILQPVAPVTTTVVHLSGGSLSSSGGEGPLAVSPRKKPRKQQHIISTEESEMMETNSISEEKGTVKPPGSTAEKQRSLPKECYDDERVCYAAAHPRPPVTLLRQYHNTWKAAYRHFEKYSDVRVKEEKKGTLRELASQRGVVCRAQGWKIHLCAAQLMQLRSLEHDAYSRLTMLQEGLIPKTRTESDDDLHHLSELIQGNMQRCKLVMDQVTETRDTMMKVLDHREKIMKLLYKNSGDKKTCDLKRKEKA